MSGPLFNENLHTLNKINQYNAEFSATNFVYLKLEEIFRINILPRQATALRMSKKDYEEMEAEEAENNEKDAMRRVKEAEAKEAKLESMKNNLTSSMAVATESANVTDLVNRTKLDSEDKEFAEEALGRKNDDIAVKSGKATQRLLRGVNRLALGRCTYMKCELVVPGLWYLYWDQNRTTLGI